MAKPITEPVESGMIQAVDPLVDAPPEVNSPLQSPPVVSGPTWGERIRRFFSFLLRLFLLLVALAVIGVALYFVLPLLYQRYVVPVEQNTAGLADLQSRQEQTEQELADLQTKFQTLETVQNQQDGSLTKLDQRLTDIETEIDARTQSLAALEKMQTELQSQNEAVAAEVERQVSLLKSMELLSRARLFMYQSNFGLARQDVQIARDLLATVQPEAPEPLTDDLTEVVRRLDLTLSNLPDFPVRASDDLDIAWQVLLSGLPEDQPTAAGTPALTVTVPPTPFPTLTPTTQGTLSPSATP